MKKHFTQISNEINLLTLKNHQNYQTTHNYGETFLGIKPQIITSNSVNILNYSEHFQVCCICFKIQQQSKRLTYLCNCNQLTHIECLQNSINQKQTNLSKNLEKLICSKCGQFYKIETKIIDKVLFKEILDCKRQFLKYYLGLGILVIGIIGLSIFYGQVLNGAPQQIYNIKINQNNIPIQKENDNIKKQQNKILSNNEIKTITFLLILLLITIFFLLFFYFVKRNLLKKKVIITKYQQSNKIIRLQLKDKTINHQDYSLQQMTVKGLINLGQIVTTKQ